MAAFSLAHLVAAALVATTAGSCAAQQTAPGPQAKEAGSILASSNPAAGSIARAPVNALVLNFDPPARLGEVLVEGPDGLMPMMISPAGEVRHYSVPMPGLGPGAYTVHWKASAGGIPSEGRFSFTAR